MELSTNSTIASRRVFVKSTFRGDRRKTQSQSGLKPSFRPDVLAKMPRSCNLVFDVLRSMIDSSGHSRASVRYLAQVTGLGTTAVWRALRRLRGARLISIATDSHGARGTVWQLRWRSPLCSFPQISVPPPATHTPRERAFSPNGTNRPPKRNRPSPRALAWAMAQVRKTIRTSYPVSKSRERTICTGIAVNIWRAMQRGEVRAGPELGDFVHDILRRLSDARGVGDKTRSWCSWGGWTVRVLVNERAAHDQELAATERFVEEVRREKEEARHGFSEFLETMGVTSLREYVAIAARALA